MTDIIGLKEKINYLFDIWVKMKTSNSFSAIDSLCIIRPIDNQCSCVCEIIDYNRDKCPDNDTSEKDNHYIYPKNSDP